MPTLMSELCHSLLHVISHVEVMFELAKIHEVAIGAHPSYPDRANFGRQVLDISDEALQQSLEEQINLVQKLCSQNQVSLHHIKPHGALYNHASKDESLSALILETITKIAPNVPWMGLADSVSERVTKNANHPFIREGFADRRYQADRTLVPRSTKGAVLKSEEVYQQVINLVVHKRVEANRWIPLEVQSVCLHSDTEGAVELAKQINELLHHHGVHIASI